MILVTGAAGKTGRTVIRALINRNLSIRAMVHKNHQVKLVKKLGVQEVIAGDMDCKDSMDKALQGISSVYHIPPNLDPGEINIGRNVIRAAQTAGVEHLVYHSVLHPQIESMPHHWQKMRVEELLFESGLSFTILQPAAYMQNILAHWNSIAEDHVYPVPYSEDTRLNIVDLDDVAEVAAIVLSESGHIGAMYELCGAEDLTQTKVVQILSQSLGYKITVNVVPAEEWEVNARNKSLGEYQVNALVKMFAYYERFGFSGNPRILTCLLGRAPTSFAAFVDRTIKK